MSNSYNSMAKKKLTIQLKIIKYLNKHFYKEDMHVTLTPVRMAITKRQETTTTEFIAIEKKKEPLCRVGKSTLVQPPRKTMNAPQKNK